MQNTKDGPYFGPEVFDGYTVEATKRNEKMWHVLSRPYSLMVTGDDFKHALVTPMSSGHSAIRPKFSGAPDVPQLQKTAILKAIQEWTQRG